ncbi:MAG: alpha/beta fold hydrolase [Myxococcota bacterium]|nr:alpha/beta fold hydrolase [Myxococcota bacterium]
MARSLEQLATIALPQRPGEPPGTLEGLFAPVPEPRAAAVVAAPHPLMGGNMDSPVVAEVARACQRAGAASLRFNWRGVGASAGVPSDDFAQADVDFQAALGFLGESVSAPPVACGYSFGSLAALRAAQGTPAIRRLVLVAPPTSMLSAQAIAEFTGELFLATGDSDEWVDPGLLAEFAEQAQAAHLEIIPDCDHFFMTGLGALAAGLERWWGPDPG